MRRYASNNTSEPLCARTSPTIDEERLVGEPAQAIAIVGLRSLADEVRHDDVRQPGRGQPVARSSRLADGNEQVHEGARRRARRPTAQSVVMAPFGRP